MERGKRPPPLARPLTHPSLSPYHPPWPSLSIHFLSTARPAPSSTPPAFPPLSLCRCKPSMHPPPPAPLPAPILHYCSSQLDALTSLSPSPTAPAPLPPLLSPPLPVPLNAEILMHWPPCFPLPHQHLSSPAASPPSPPPSPHCCPHPRQPPQVRSSTSRRHSQPLRALTQLLQQTQPLLMPPVVLVQRRQLSITPPCC